MLIKRFLFFLKMHVFYDERDGGYRIRGFLERGIDLNDDNLSKKRKSYTLTIEIARMSCGERMTDVSSVTYSFRGRNIHVISGVSQLAEDIFRERIWGREDSLEYHLGKFIRAFVEPELLRTVNERSPRIYNKMSGKEGKPSQ